ncbi:hypothetical protein KKD19_03280 [Patescibacteria group bacterium]|nr:hypothetical protein [Patescibacteria group bacterium]MBU4512238.1 hypothetical protein [Patescibacteria group bacterium]MCG2692656.1 hypothetical protein [Candidatus Parcubacteria bacterium]
MSTKDLENQLQKLGFSDHETKIYLTLLDMGLTSTGPIIKKTGLHRNIVYDTLNKLVNRKLVSQSDQRGVKHFKALNPEKILQAKEEQFNIAKALIPQLAKLKKSEKVEVVIYEGDEGFQTAHKNAINYIKPDQTIYVMGAGGQKFYNAMGDTIEYFDKVRNKKQNILKLLSYEIRKDEFTDKKTLTRPLIETKYLPVNFSNPAGTSIYNDKVFILIYSNPPIIIEIISREVAESYKNYFNLLWKIAKK